MIFAPTDSTITPMQYRELVSRTGIPRRAQKSTRKSLLEARIPLLRKSGLEDWEIAIQLLMERPKLAWRWTIEGEQLICVQFADRMRKHVMEGRYRGIWGHIPNESRRSQIVACILRAMGMITGATDYFFMWQYEQRLGTGFLQSLNCGVIEFKTEDGAIQASQRLYESMCQHFGIPHAYARSADEGEAILRQWGAISGQ